MQIRDRSACPDSGRWDRDTTTSISRIRCEQAAHGNFRARLKPTLPERLPPSENRVENVSSLEGTRLPGGSITMQTHIGIVCPSCQETGKVRAAFLGCKIRCKHCHSKFRVPLSEEGAPATVSMASTCELQMPIAGEGVAREREANFEASPQTLSPEVLLARLVSRDQKYAKVKQQLVETRERCSLLTHQLQAMRDEGERVRDESLFRGMEEVRSERNRFGALVQALEGRFAGAEGLADVLQASRSEVDRLRTELTTARSAVEGARVEWESRLAGALHRVASLTEALGAEREERAALRTVVEAQDRERAAWEAERRALQADWEEERGALTRQVEQWIRLAEEHSEAALIRSEREREALQGVLDQLHHEVGPLRDERDAMRPLLESLTREREEMTTIRDQLIVSFQERDNANRARITELGHALQLAIQEKDAERQRGEELADQVRTLLVERERQPQDHEGERQQSLQLLATLQQDLKTQQSWIERMAADRSRNERREVPEVERDALQQEINALRGEREATLTLLDSLTREREQLTTFRNQLKASFQERETAYESRLNQFGLALQKANQEKAAMRQRGHELAEQVRGLQEQLSQRSQIRESDRLRSLSYAVPREQGPSTNPSAVSDVPVAEAGITLAIAHTDVALSQLGTFTVRRK